MDANDDAGCLNVRVVLAVIVGTPPGAELAPTVNLWCLEAAIKKARSLRSAPFSMQLYQLPSAFEASQNNPADRATVAGRVNTQASRMVLTVPPCRPLLLATIVPATPEDSTWVVETGRLKTFAKPIRLAVVICADMPWE